MCREAGLGMVEKMAETEKQVWLACVETLKVARPRVPNNLWPNGGPIVLRAGEMNPGWIESDKQHIPHIQCSLCGRKSLSPREILGYYWILVLCRDHAREIGLIW